MTEAILMNEILAMRDAGATAISCDMSDAAGRRDDIAWFAAHPDRGFRLREAMLGEPVKKGAFMLVKQLEPGVWVCAPAYRSGSVINKATLAELASASDSDTRAAYFDLVLQLIWEDLQRKRFRPIGVIYAQVGALQALATTTRQ